MTPLVLPVLLLVAQPADPPAGAAPADALLQAASLIEEGQNTKANLHRALKIYKQALRTKTLSKVKRALALTDMSRARLRLGDISDDKKARLAHYKAGRTLAKEAQHLDPTLADAYFWEAANLAVIGRTNGVTSSLFMINDLKEKLYKTLELDPKHVLAKETIGSIYAAVPGLLGGDDDKAEDLYQEVIRQDPHFTQTKVTYAKFLVERGREDEARALLRAVVKEPHSSSPNDHRKFTKPDAQQLLKKLGGT